MDSCEAAQMVFARVKSLEPTAVSRIMGQLLLHDHSNTEMFNLAFSTDAELKDAVAKAKKELLASDNQQQQRKNNPSPPPPPPNAKNVDAPAGGGGKPSRNGGTTTPTTVRAGSNPKSRSGSPQDTSSTPCKYFVKGHCKLGNTCPYAHPEAGSPQGLHRQKSFPGGNGNGNSHGNGNHGNHDKEEPSDVNARQIYLTFPSDSRFTEEDVVLHFSNYGAVEDVRIPSQPRRMFGFVTFQHAETAKAILSDNNPHFICGSRVLVKPYRDRPLNERKQAESSPPLTSEDEYVGNLMGADAVRRSEEDKKNLELERKLAELHLAHARAKVEAALMAASSHMEQSRLLSKFLQPDANYSSLKDFYRQNSQGLQQNSLPGHGLQQKFPAELINFMGPPTGFPLGYAYPSNSTQYFTGLPQNFKPAPPSFGAGAGSGSGNGNTSLPDPRDLMCCICFEFPPDPIQLDCAHLYCSDCLVRAAQASGTGDECPLCSRNMGNKVHKTLQTRESQPPWFGTSSPENCIW